MAPADAYEIVIVGAAAGSGDQQAVVIASDAHTIGRTEDTP
jgi:hypothetical protein